MLRSYLIYCSSVTMLTILKILDYGGRQEVMIITLSISVAVPIARVTLDIRIFMRI